MSVFTNRLKNKLAQATYRPGKKRPATKGLMSVLEDFFIREEGQKDDKKKVEEKGEKS